MANFDAFSPRPTPDSMDWRGIHSAIDGFVAQREKADAQARAQRAATLFSKGDFNAAIDASGDPEFGLKVRGEQRLAAREPYITTKMVDDIWEARRKGATEDPVYKRTEELKKQADALEALGETELAERYRKRIAEAGPAYEEVFRRYGISGTPPPLPPLPGFPGGVGGVQPRPAQSPASAAPAAPAPSQAPAAGAPVAVPPGFSVGNAPQGLPGGQPAPAPRPAAPAADPYAMPVNPRIAELRRQQQLGQIVPGAGIDPDKSIEWKGLEAYEKEAAQSRAKQLTETQAEFETIAQTKLDLGVLRSLLPSLETGFRQDQVTAMQFLAERLGWKVDGVPANQLFQQLSQRLVLAQAARMKGSLSDKDVAFLQAMTANTSMSREALADSINVLDTWTKRQEFAAQQKARILNVNRTPNMDAIHSFAIQQFPTPELYSAQPQRQNDQQFREQLRRDGGASVPPASPGAPPAPGAPPQPGAPRTLRYTPKGVVDEQGQPLRSAPPTPAPPKTINFNDPRTIRDAWSNRLG